MLPSLEVLVATAGAGAGCHDPNASFFGFMGITIGISFASNIEKYFI